MPDSFGSIARKLAQNETAVAGLQADLTRATMAHRKKIADALEQLRGAQ